MQDFEKLGAFFLGRPYDLGRKQPGEGWVLYDSKDLVTHAVCVGMTGSGKTGLCLGLLEEAAIDGIPALAIDPKGDLSNLLLTFPHLRGRDFLPWINEEDARKKNLAPEAYAEQQAALWKKGLAEWGQDGARIARMKDAADFAVYTPGSRAGLPVSILKAFAAPSADMLGDDDLLREHINATVASLLSLAGAEADPLTSPPHILISTILETAWRKRQDLELVPLIEQIQTPPFARLGALDLDAFYPAKDRFALARQLNNLVAAPGFEAWLDGEPLDIGRMLYAESGRPRMSIFSIAHLNDAERMFFVSLLLNQVIGWMRAQSGTTSLRAILYMDEIFGYFPPVANPPSKTPLLTLLKQARAYGLGVVLATQNPVDLDYKGLSNTGTWFIGRLQTERDKARVLEGLEGAAAGSDKTFDRRQMEELLAGLGKRIFLMNNVHEERPVVFETRWTLSYLRGPLTRAQIKVLMQQTPDTRRVTRGESHEPSRPAPRTSRPAPTGRPLLPPDVPQFFIPLRGTRPPGAQLRYEPRLLGGARVRIGDAKTKVDMTTDLTVLAPMAVGAAGIDWDAASPVDLALDDLEHTPQADADYGNLPAPAARAKSYEAWRKEFADWAYRTQTILLLRSPAVKIVSHPGESERDFRIRLQQVAREVRDETTERLRRSYAPKMAALEERLRRAEQARGRESDEASQQHLQTAISFGATLVATLLGRKRVSATSVGRATTAARGVGRSMKKAQDVARAGENVEAIRTQLSALEAQLKADLDALGKQDQAEPLETITIRPTKSNISVKLVALGWVPHWHDGQAFTPAWR